MRWRYIDNQSETELLYRRRVLDQIEIWWQQFSKRSKEFESHIRGRRPLPIEELANWVDDGLTKINENLLWELWPGDNDVCLFIITPELDHFKRPLVKTIIEMAPQIEGWTFLPVRPALTVDVLESIFESRTGLSIPETKVACVRSSRNVVDVTFFSDSFSGANDRDDIETAYCLCEYLLGEDTLNKWIGNISTEVINTNASRIVNLFGRDKQLDISHTKSLSEFAQAVDKVVLEIKVQIDDEPLRLQNLVSPALVSFKDEELQPMRRTFVSSKRNIIESIVLNGIFYSERFTKHGEKFCYLKIAEPEQLTSFEAFAALRTAIDEQLRLDECGCVFGWGASPKVEGRAISRASNDSSATNSQSPSDSAYIYIDLALEKIDEAIVALRLVAQREKLSENSWLLFFDTELEQEWVGLLPETGAP